MTVTNEVHAVRATDESDVAWSMRASALINAIPSDIDTGLELHILDDTEGGRRTVTLQIVVRAKT